MKYQILGFVVTCLTLALAQEDPQVTIPGLGILRGGTDKATNSDRLFYSFRAVPYAAPPVGSLRFQPPAPLSPWDGVINATHLARKCPQTSFTKKSMEWQSKLLSQIENHEEDIKAGEVEDCLYLHIYTPKLDTAANLPVIVYFHGGSFLTGSALIYGPDRFMDEDVILVVPHYRLGPIGFISLETDAIPGNAGMLDQVAAVQFVKNYISLFGGNPNAITVMGESAGGASSSLLHISPLSTGLFQGYIAQSGSAVANWAIDREPKRAAIEIGQLAGCTNSEINALTACLQSVDAMTLLEAFDVFIDIERKAGRTGFAGSSPVIQKAGSVRFLEREPIDILNDGNYIPKPALMGSNKHEGTLLYGILYVSFLAANDLLEDEVYLSRGFTNFLLDFFDIQDQGEAIAVGIEKAHIGFENMGNITAMAPGLIDFMGNMFLKGPTFHAAQINSRDSPTYVYSFNYDGPSSLWLFLGEPSAPIPGGVCHANELILQFKIPSFLINDEERAVSQQILKMWTNFATYGDPTPVSNPVEGVPTWLPYTDSEPNYLRIDVTSSLMQDVTKNEYFIAQDEKFPW